MVSQDISIDENLPCFFKTLRFYEANGVILEYYNMKFNYGIEIEDP